LLFDVPVVNFMWYAITYLLFIVLYKYFIVDCLVSDTRHAHNNTGCCHSNTWFHILCRSVDSIGQYIRVFYELSFKWVCMVDWISLWKNRLSSMVLVIFLSRKNRSSLLLVSSTAQLSSAYSSLFSYSAYKLSLHMQLEFVFNRMWQYIKLKWLLNPDNSMPHHCYHPISYFNMICPC